jgi:hypothetical protein
MNGAPVDGTLLLTPVGTDGQFETYVVSKVDWLYLANGSAKTVTGSGTYKVSTKDPIQQQLSLDLQMGGDSVQHFDSGLVSASSLFPKIAVTISLHGQVCFDMVFDIVLSPVVVPPLRAALDSAGTVTLSWPTSSNSFVLQECSDLRLSRWAAMTNRPAMTNGQNQVIVERSAERKFYQLIPAE